MPDSDTFLRIVLALALGGAIGLERRWRGHAAGPHTNALVAAGAALFMIMAKTLGGDALFRVAAQVPAAVGFLAGGVILRDGFQVRGLNTAATIWCVAAVGCLAGAASYTVAAGAAFLIVAANSAFHLLEHRVARVSHVSEEEFPSRPARRNRPR
jgi:putative Mg2+ transporter-C (MgtC) family protein